MKKVGNMKLYSFEERAVGWTKWGLGWRKRAVGARKIGADSGFRGGDCHAENGVLMGAIATILGKNFFLLW